VSPWRNIGRWTTVGPFRYLGRPYAGSARWFLYTMPHLPISALIVSKFILPGFQYWPGHTHRLQCVFALNRPNVPLEPLCWTWQLIPWKPVPLLNGLPRQNWRLCIKGCACIKGGGHKTFYTTPLKWIVGGSVVDPHKSFHPLYVLLCQIGHLCQMV